MKTTLMLSILLMSLTLHSRVKPSSCEAEIEAAIPVATAQISELLQRLPSESQQTAKLKELHSKLTAADKILIKKTEAELAPLVLEVSSLMGSRYSGDYRRMIDLEAEIKKIESKLKTKVTKNIRITSMGKVELFVSTITKLKCLTGYNNPSRDIRGNEIIESQWMLNDINGGQRISNSLRFMLGNVRKDKDAPALFSVCARALISEDCRDLIN